MSIEILDCLFKGLVKSYIFEKFNFAWKSPYFRVPFHRKLLLHRFSKYLSRNKWLLVFLCSEKVPWTKKKYLERELKLSLILSLLWLHMGVVLVVEFSLYISTFLLINNNIIQIFSAVSAVAMASVLGCAQILKEGKPSEKKFSQTSAMPRFSWFFSTRNGQNQLNVSLNTTTPW